MAARSGAGWKAPRHDSKRRFPSNSGRSREHRARTAPGDPRGASDPCSLSTAATTPGCDRWKKWFSASRMRPPEAFPDRAVAASGRATFPGPRRAPSHDGTSSGARVDVTSKILGATEGACPLDGRPAPAVARRCRFPLLRGTVLHVREHSEAEATTSSLGRAVFLRRSVQSAESLVPTGGPVDSAVCRSTQ
jgi:hypothetical protein